MKKSAFTLAEVLITLVILGIIAAITIPVILSNHSREEQKSRVKKAYSTLANAMTKVKAAGGDLEFDFVDANNENINNWYNKYLAPNLITMKVCYDTAGCWHNDDNLLLNGTPVPWNRKGVGIGHNIITAILNDGTTINLDVHSQNRMVNYFGVNSNTVGLVIFFDINGGRKPNIIGKDVFAAVYTAKGFVPAYKDKTAAQKQADCSASGTGISCINNFLKP